ncbi:MAG: hypothetical protein P4L55_05040 [Syntrophobacteraceae bacterium]|nr:hypothetical protein [Syntrophobacteraceae bacterium]
MHELKEVLTHIYNFMASHDLTTVIQQISTVKLSVIAKSPLAWLIGLPIFTYFLWTKKIKAMVGIVSFFAFALLAQNTVMQTGNELNLQDVVVFVGGTAVLIALNLYLLFVRQ